MSAPSLATLCRLFIGTSLPRFFIGSGLAFVGSLALDRWAFMECTRTAQACCLSLTGLCFLLSDHRPLTLAAVAIPATLIFKENLLSSGGTNLLLGIGFAAKWISDQCRKYRNRNLPDVQNSEPSGMLGDKDGNIPTSLHQLAYWYFVPRSTWLWNLIIGSLEGHEFRYFCVAGVYTGLGVWSLLPYVMPMVRANYPRFYTTIFHYLQERPASHLYSIGKISRHVLDRLIFNLLIGSPPTYQYRLLDSSKSEIRLLKLHAAGSLNIVKADLVSVPIAKAPPFEAISYRWASGHEVPILLDDQRFVVSGEVHEILRTVRPRHGSRLLWVDSICIDQSNIHEKEWQIEFMTQIYGSCTQVIGWIAVMPQIPFLPGSLRWLAELAKLEESHEELSHSFLQGDLCSQMRASIVTLCNEFFFRIWIIQEVALAQKLILKFGQEEMSWEVFYKNVGSFMAFHARNASLANFGPIMHTRMAQASLNIRSLEEFRVDRKRFSEGIPLGQLLIGSVDFEASDPRDRVFGLLGLSTDIARTKIPISYRPETTAISVLVQVTTFTLVVESSFLLLEMAGIGLLPDEVNSNFAGPSWVPRWGFKRISYVKVLASTCNKLYETATRTPRVVDVSMQDSRALVIQGVRVDKIKQLSKPWLALELIVDASYTTLEEMYVVFSTLLQDLHGAFKMVEQAHHPVYADVDRRSLVWRTICHDSRKVVDGGQSFDEDGKEAEEAVREICSQLRKLLERGVRGSAGTDAVENLNLTSGILAVANLLPMQWTRLCITEEGYFGIVPTYAKEGDEIWAFSGAPNPFVLRKNLKLIENKGLDTHQLVGVCYVDGIMKGELRRSELEPTMVNLV